MKRKLQILIMVLLPLCSLNAQFVAHGPLFGIGFGGLKADGVEIKSGLNPELGYMFKYNLTEKVSLRSSIALEFHKFKLDGGRMINDVHETPLTVVDAPIYEFNANTVSNHYDFTYIIKEDAIDISAGLFFSVRFIKNNFGQSSSRIFYNTTDSEILNLPNQTGIFETGQNNETELYASDQIQNSLKGIAPGFSLSATAGSAKFKAMLRYDIFLKNYYSKFSVNNKLKESYIRLGLIYFLNS